MAKNPKPLDQIVHARGWLEMTEQFPELLARDDVPAKIAEVRIAFQHLLDFRNLVAGMAPMTTPPKESVQNFLDV
jgi:hypothetical protein